MTKETVLVIAAHPDDEVLGCGATMAKHVAQGDLVHVAIMAEGARSRGDTEADIEIAKLKLAAERANTHLGVSDLSFFDFPDNKMDSVPQLDVIQKIESLIKKVKPTRIYTHSPHDVNVDHRVIVSAVEAAARPQPQMQIKSILAFEVQSSSEWRFSGHGAFTPNWFEDVSLFWAKKMEALRHYEVEMRPWPHARSYEAVEHLLKWRGASVGVTAAEAFILLRGIR
jgi:N-acetylglucosamine malate deacetylase 1